MVGGLDLDSYCQSIGDASSTTPGPGQETPAAPIPGTARPPPAGQTPINVQSDCLEQHPGQVTIAYPQDPDNSYSWVCLAPGGR